MRLETDYPGVANPVADSKCNNDVGETRTNGSYDGHGDEDVRHREHHIGETHDNGVELASRIARDHPENRTDEGREQHPGETDDCRNPGAIDDPTQNIPAKGVGAKKVCDRTVLLPKGRFQRVHQALLGRVMGRNPLGQHGADKEGKDDCGRKFRDSADEHSELDFLLGFPRFPVDKGLFFHVSLSLPWGRLPYRRCPRKG